jgi:hypothetical protein
MRMIALMLMLLGTVGAAHAQWTYTLDPPHVQAGGAINLRIDDDNIGCFFSHGNPQIQRNGSVVTVTIGMTDEAQPGGCPPTWATPRLMPIGSFGSGNYEVHVIVCTNAPGPQPCETEATLSLSVLGLNGRRFTVPTLSGAIVILLVFAVMAIGAVVPKRT